MPWPVVLAVAVAALTTFLLLRRHARRGLRVLDPASASMFYGASVPEAKVPNYCINVVMYFKEMPPKERTLQVLQDELIGKHLEFRALPVQTWKGLVWQEVPTKVEDHFVFSEVASEAELHKHIEGITSVDIRGYPNRLWELHYIANPAGGRGVLLFRIEHCIGDGLSLMKLFIRLITDEAGQPFEMPTMRHRPVEGPQPGALQKALRLLQALAASVDMTSGPADSFNPCCPWKGRIPVFCTRQSVVVIPRHRLELVKRIKDKAGATVNDVVFCCLAGALRRYFKARGVDPEGMERVRALVPFAFPKTSTRLCNSWAFVSVRVPVWEKTAKERLEHTIQAWNALKQSYLAPVMLFITHFLTGLLPLVMTRATATGTLLRHTVVVSNVPGPDRPVRVCGALLDEVQMIYRNLVPQVGLLSYNGELFGNFVVDPDVVPEAHTLPGYYLEELRALAEAYGVEQP
eukprot:EG_transcript_6847